MASQIVDEAVISLPRGRRGADQKERRAAGVGVAKVLLTHPCELDPTHGVTHCDHPSHHSDVEAVRLMLEAVGLVPTRRPVPPAPKAPGEPATTKRCSRCRKTKPIAGFDRNRANLDGHSFHCKTCRTEVNALKKQRAPVTPDAKRCTRCQLTKLAAEFSVDRARADGLTSRCKDCRNDVRRERHEAKEAVNA